MLVEVEISGKTYHFLFDTGAITIITPELQQALGTKSVTTNTFKDAAGIETEEAFYMIPEVKLGGVTFTNVAAGSFDLKDFSDMLCHPLDGIFGTNMMRLCNWKIDYTGKKITMSTDKMKLDSANKIEFQESFSGTPIVKMDTGGYNFPIQMDTGNNGSIDIPHDLYNKMRHSKTGTFKRSMGKGFLSLSGNKEQDEFVGRADSVYIGKTLMRGQRLRVSDSPMLLIGNDFWKQFGQVAINWKKGELLLPKAHSATEPEWTFGFSPLRKDGKTLVVQMWENSPAQRDGLVIGDEIKRIDSYDLAAVSDAKWCEIRALIREKETVEIEVVKADGKTLVLKLERYDLLSGK